MTFNRQSHKVTTVREYLDAHPTNNITFRSWNKNYQKSTRWEEWFASDLKLALERGEYVIAEDDLPLRLDTPIVVSYLDFKRYNGEGKPIGGSVFSSME